MSNSNYKPKPGKTLAQVSGARTLRSAANTSQATRSTRLAIYFYATAALLHPGAGPSAGTRSKPAHPRQRAGRKRGQAKDGAFPKESPRFRVTRGTGAAFCWWRALTSAQQQSTAQGLLGPCSQWPASTPQTPACVHLNSFSSPPQTSLTPHAITGDICHRQATSTFL